MAIPTFWDGTAYFLGWDRLLLGMAFAYLSGWLFLPIGMGSVDCYPQLLRCAYLLGWGGVSHCGNYHFPNPSPTFWDGVGALPLVPGFFLRYRLLLGMAAG